MVVVYIDKYSEKGGCTIHVQYRLCVLRMQHIGLRHMCYILYSGKTRHNLDVVIKLDTGCLRAKAGVALEASSRSASVLEFARTMFIKNSRSHRFFSNGMTKGRLEGGVVSKQAWQGFNDTVRFLQGHGNSMIWIQQNGMDSRLDRDSMT
ncbi:hypothetical protein BDA99DRAFT_567297 [Phascolomyces articulosus]|uniref:Uncharacterized protein n=1 Tax=Phascolomyces articulosus TaxID=60185 RepID=A0AAD5KRN6_9FUNG|nr:hypothetical protein BDA99DRAFT_567297 [Phascolomyces articulosus]